MLPGVPFLLQSFKTYPPLIGQPKLSFLSSKCVLQYLEANRRIQLSQRCPAIRTRERMIPLRIRKLKIENSTLTINKITYKLQVTTSLGATENKDLDHYGATDLDQPVEKGPNEIVLDYRSLLSESGRVYSEMQSIGEERKRVDEIQDEESKASAENLLRRRVKMHEVNSLRMLARASNTPPPVTVMQIPIEFAIRFTFGAPGEAEIQESLIYSRKLHDAMKYLLVKLLGGRKIIDTYKLSIKCSKGIIRIPTNLNLQFQYLKVVSEGDTDEILRDILPLLEQSKCPLKSLETRGASDFDAPIFHSAQQLVLVGDEEWEPSITDILNIRFKKSALKFLTNYMDMIITIWKSHGKEIGTCWTFSLGTEEQAKAVMEMIKWDRRAQFLGRSSVYPLKNSHELFIYYEKSERDGNNWDLHFTVRERSFFFVE